MATIRASCPDCGDVEITSNDVTARVCAEDNRGSYVFRCPACTMAVTKPAEPRIIDLLAASGVQLVVWKLPAELSEPRLGRLFTHDDLLAFHETLSGDDWFAELASLTKEI